MKEKIENFIMKFSYREIRRRKMQAFKWRLETLRLMEKEELEFEYVEQKVKCEHKKNVCEVLLMIVLLGIVMGIWREFFAFIRILYQYTVISGYDGIKEMNICFLLSVILAAALTLAILIPVCDGVEDMKAAKRDLADKLLVCSALICMIELRELPAWMVIIIISREFIISGFRLVASDNGVVIAASYWGKFKTTFQMIGVVLLIFNIPALSTLTTIIVWIALALTVISLVDYIVKNAGVLTEGKM